MSKEEFYKYGESLGIKVNDLQRLKMLAVADKKYTEEDMKKAFKFYAYAHISNQPNSYEKLEQDYLKFINSLNKQD